MKSPFPKLGMTIIEVVVAAAMTALMGLVMTGLIVRANALATSARNKSQATKLAEQILEQTRGFRNQNPWATFHPKSGTSGSPNCYPPGSFAAALASCPPSLPYPPIAGTIFSGYVSLERLAAPDDQTVTVKAVISYNDHGQEKTVTAATYLANVQ